MAVDPALRRIKRIQLIFDLFKITFIAVVLVCIIRFFIAEPFIVSGDSMEPSFYPNDYLVIDELSYEIHKPNRGDVIVFRYPEDPSIYFIKRLIGVPGDRVVVTNGSVFVTSGKQTTKLLTEPYVQKDRPRIETGTTTLGADEYFVLGDNRNASFDSRIWGPVPERYIIGKVVTKLYPFSRFQLYTGASVASSSVPQ